MALDNPDLDQKPVGSGPYELAERIEVTGIPNDNARLSALRSGQVDMAMTTAAQYDEATKIGDGFTTHEYAPASPYTVYLNSGLGDLADVKVRQALNWAVDRQAISDTLLSGKCEPSGQLLGSVFDGHLEAPAEDYSHDPDKAKALLDEAGVTDLNLKILVPAGLTLYEQIGTAVQAQFEEIGDIWRIRQRPGHQAEQHCDARDVSQPRALSRPGAGRLRGRAAQGAGPVAVAD